MIAPPPHLNRPLSQYHSLFIDFSRQLFMESKCHIAYLDISSKGQYTFNNILSSYYQNNEKKLLVSQKKNKNL